MKPIGGARAAREAHISVDIQCRSGLPCEQFRVLSTVAKAVADEVSTVSWERGAGAFSAAAVLEERAGSQRFQRGGGRIAGGIRCVSGFSMAVAASISTVEGAAGLGVGGAFSEGAWWDIGSEAVEVLPSEPRRRQRRFMKTRTRAKTTPKTAAVPSTDASTEIFHDFMAARVCVQI